MRSIWDWAAGRTAVRALAVGCGLSAGATAADSVPVRLPDAVAMNSNYAAGPKSAVVPAAYTSLAGGDCTTCPDAGCTSGNCFPGHAQRKADRKQMLAGAKNCKYVPAPIVPSIGTWTREAFAHQSSNALAEYFVLNREEWVIGTAELHPGGQRHLEGIVRRLGGNSHPVKVESSGIPALDEQRKAAVAQSLIQGGCDAAASIHRVVIGGSRAEGLRYEEIESVYYRSVYGRVGSGSGYGAGGVNMFGSGR